MDKEESKKSDSKQKKQQALSDIENWKTSSKEKIKTECVSFGFKKQSAFFKSAIQVFIGKLPSIDETLDKHDYYELLLVWRNFKRYKRFDNGHLVP
jgi:hypothetical protein